MTDVLPLLESAAGPVREWVSNAIERLEREAARSADSHLIQVEFAGFPDIRFYFKDEAAHPTGSLKHRLARSLFLYALCNGRLHPGQTVVDASSGSTAISEAWFARLLGVPFVAVLVGRRYGGSSGTNLVACVRLAESMRSRGESGSIVSLLCDRGERYAETLFNPDWRDSHGLDIRSWLTTLRGNLTSKEPRGRRAKLRLREVPFGNGRGS